jgi:hypothetical protein
MRLILDPTEDFFMAGDVMVRMWTGTDDEGRPVVALVAGFGLADGSARAPLLPGMVPLPPPGPEDAQRWARQIMGSTKGTDDGD